MLTIRVAVLVVCLSATSLFAQTSVEEQPAVPASPDVVMAVPEPAEIPAPAEVRNAAPSQPAGKKPLSRVAVEDVTGGHGELLIDNATAPASGVMLKALSGTPDIFAKLGLSTSGASFNVLDASDVSVLKVRGDGYAILRRDQDAVTGLEINNANPGSASVSSSRFLRFFEGGTVTARVGTNGSASSAASGGSSALQVWNVLNAPIIFGTTAVERMRIHGDGNVTVGVTNNFGKFAVYSTAPNGYGLYAVQRATVGTSSSQNDTGFYSETIDDIGTGITNSGGIIGARIRAWKIGAGTITWATGGHFQVGNFAGTSGTVTNAFAVQVGVSAGTGTVTNGYGVYIADTEATNDYGVYSVGANDTNYFAGNVVIGGPAIVPAPNTNNALNVQGNANFNGTVTGTNIKAHFQDVAEWVPATTDLTPGTVVILNRQRNNEVMASATAYDTTVAGVVSAQPGLSLGMEGEGKEQVATTGRVKVRVDARAKAIRIGDLLVTSDMAGTAMRSEPMSINGRAFHQPGTIIGKALEPLDSGIGEILVLLSMQ